MSQDKEREAFESLYLAKGGHPHNLKRDDRGGYLFTIVQHMWEAWEARAALASQQAVKGEPVAWALLTNGKPNAPRGRTLSWEPPCNESLQIAAIEGESWVPLFASPPSREPLTDDAILDAFCHTPGIHQFVQAFKAGARFAERAHGIHSHGEGES